MSMEQMLKDIIDEKVETEEFAIKDSNSAEWALQKILQKKTELLQFESVCDSMISDYEDKKKKEQDKFKNSTGFLELKLKEYFDTAVKKVTKTKKSIKLPSGSLELKNPKQEFVRDNETLVKWLKENKKDAFIKVKEEPMWKELKETITVEGDNIITEDGEIVEGIEVKMSDPNFEVKV